MKLSRPFRGGSVRRAAKHEKVNKLLTEPEYAGMKKDFFR
jgi:hypothetical protein